MLKKIWWFFEDCLPVSALMVMFVVSSYQVFCRYVLNDSSSWSEELARMMFVDTTFLSLGMVALRGGHLEINVTKTLCGPKMRYAATVISALATLTFCGFLVVWGAMHCQFVYSIGQDNAALPGKAWMFWVAFPIGFLMMFVRTFLNWIRDMRALKERDRVTV